MTASGDTGDLAGTWIGTAPAVELIRLTRAGEGYSATIDRAAAGRFGEPIEVVARPAARTATAGADWVEFADGLVVLAGRDGTRTRLQQVLRPASAAFESWCGWYAADGRTVLVTQFPEGYFGDPMWLIAEGDVVVRAYPVGEHRLVRADGAVIELRNGGDHGQLALRAGTERGAVLPRTERYRERPVTFAAGDLPLSGTLIVPAGPGPHPAAVIVHGAAGGQRDYCRLFAAPLLDAGVAVLIYDKQGHGRSGNAPEPTIFDQAAAVSAALDILAATPGLDPGRLGVLGVSNGMWAAPMAAARRPDIAFVAGVGSPGVSMAESEVHRRVKVLRDAGVGAQTLSAVAEAWRCIFGVAASAHASKELRSRLATLLAYLQGAPDLDRYQLPEFARQEPMLSPLPPSLPVSDLIAMLAAEPDPELAYDPADDYRRLHCPVFLQYGSDDTSVPAATSAERIASALREAGDPRSAIRVYPNLEHLLTVVPDDLAGIAPEEAMYLFHCFRYGPGVRSDLTTWLRAVIGSGRRN
jgi:uncharacterized protein